jgi:hypothetical protein
VADSVEVEDARSSRAGKISGAVAGKDMSGEALESEPRNLCERFWGIEVGGVMFEVIVEVRFTEVMADEASGFQVMIKQ